MFIPSLPLPVPVMKLPVQGAQHGSFMFRQAHSST